MKLFNNIGAPSNRWSLSVPCYLTVLVFFAHQWNGTAQELKVDATTDSILPIHLQEVILISNYKKALEHQLHQKPLATLGNYLEASKKVNMIRRGAYAWEPVLNDMGTDRLSVTIDGMRIFGACTDRMDPITSYVDVSNLSDIHVASGQQGAQHGAVIGGAINLRLEKSNFKHEDWVGSVETGFESNNTARIVGAELNYSNEAFYVDTDIIYRKAENYVAGGGEEVNFSQFEKYNLSINGGYKLNDSQKLVASFIYDEARDVGYPALPMDVSLARAFIGSVSFEQTEFLGSFTDWETKVYANTITHIMDDSQRPDVPIRMDMPGWSDTYGYFSQAKLVLDKHHFLMKFDGFYNRSLAEMTMFPNNPNERDMFMLTWPDVRTLNNGVYVEDVIKLKEASLKISGRFAWQSFNVADEFGLNSLRIFYPQMQQRQNRWLKSVATQYHTKLNRFHFTTGLSYGDRAPTVSEGFGFYLFNSFDNHDYIGDPDIENERAIEVNAKTKFKGEKLEVGISGSFFHTMDYIIGEINPDLSVMTIGAEGVKVFQNLAYANLYNIALDTEFKVDEQWTWSGLVSYHRGRDQDGRNLPFISPLAYRSTLQYNGKKFTGSITMNGAADQVNFNPEFGEDRTDAFTVFSAALGTSFKLNKGGMHVKAGIENMFDTLYSTYTDWNNIPRMGRNVFMTVSYAIN